MYRTRPKQCRTWPFWPENMNKKVWFGDVIKDCPGIGVGPLIDAKQIEKRLRKAAIDTPEHTGRIFQELGHILLAEHIFGQRRLGLGPFFRGK